jgi:ketosteroid isomerase-like protein
MLALLLMFAIAAGSNHPVAAAEGDRIRAIREHDGAVLREMYADDFVGVTGNGRKVRKPEVLAVFSKVNDGLLFSTTDSDVYTSGNVAIFTALLVGKSGEEVVYQMRFLHVWEKRGGKWVLVRGESTDLPAAPR